jgi:hypothetical protein
LEASARLRLRLIGLILGLAGPSSALPGFLARTAANLPLVTERFLFAQSQTVTLCGRYGGCLAVLDSCVRSNPFYRNDPLPFPALY